MILKLGNTGSEPPVEFLQLTQNLSNGACFSSIYLQTENEERKTEEVPVINIFGDCNSSNKLCINMQDIDNQIILDWIGTL